MSVIVAKDGPVTIVTIDRSATSHRTRAAREAFAAFAKDTEARVAILTGRPVAADKRSGSASPTRVAADGEALVTALELAKQIASLHEQRPAQCLSPMGFRHRRHAPP